MFAARLPVSSARRSCSTAPRSSWACRFPSSRAPSRWNLRRRR
jgi:hypothetical protein